MGSAMAHEPVNLVGLGEQAPQRHVAHAALARRTQKPNNDAVKAPAFLERLLRVHVALLVAQAQCHIGMNQVANA